MSNHYINNKSDDGYIVVETIGAFIPFLLLIISVLSLVNIVAVQARIHYALTQAADALAVYCYTLEVIGLANDMTVLADKAERVDFQIREFEADVKGVVRGVESMDIGEIAGHGGAIGERTLSVAEAAAGDPEQVLQLLLNYGISEVGSKVMEEVMKPLIGRYLANGSMSGDEYLRSMGVISCRRNIADKAESIRSRGLAALDFSGVLGRRTGDSMLIDKYGNVRLSVEYEIEYTFFGLKLPFEPAIRITQTVVTKAWLNGSGKGYR